METFKTGDWVVILRENCDKDYMVGVVGKYDAEQGNNHKVDIPKEICPKNWSGSHLHKKGNKNFPDGNYYYAYCYKSADTRLPALRHALPHEIPEEFQKNVLKSLIIW